MRRAAARLVILSCALGVGRASAASGPVPAASAQAAAVQTSPVLDVMKRAAEWQLAHPSRHAPYDWTQAAFYIGVMALADVSGEAKYLDAMQAMGEANQWRPGPRPGHADDYAVITTYAKLAQIDGNKARLGPSVALFDFLSSRPYDEPLAWGDRIETRELAWCDALFMGPPAMAAVTTVTGDRKYLGMLGWVQAIGAEPGTSRHDTTEVYGVGALLLAGSEVFRLETGARQ